MSVGVRVPSWVAIVAGALAWLHVTAAFANGRFPRADQLVIDPSDPHHLLARATFGFIETHDGGASWSWICEEIVGRIATTDPPIAITGDGTIVVAVPFDGVAVSHDKGCSWTRAPPPLAGQLVVDMTLEPRDPAGLLVLSSTNVPRAGGDAGLELVNRIVETKDNARTWGQLGIALPGEFIATTLEVAPSDPNRIYVGGVIGDPPSEAIEQSGDRGQTWTLTKLPGPMTSAGVFIGAIDPKDPDRVWIRIFARETDALGMAPTTLRVSSDRGATWKDLAETTGSMFGFALATDATSLAYGGQDGVFIGPSDGSGEFKRVSTLNNRCLTWATAGLYACGTEPIDLFTVGLSTDAGERFDALYKLADTCPQSCPDDGPFVQVCRASWTDPLNGVATLTRATEKACSVAWAKVSGDGTIEDAAGDGGDRGAREGSTASAPFEASGGCSCQTGRADGRGPHIVGAGALALYLARRRRRTEPPRPRFSRRPRRC